LVALLEITCTPSSQAADKRLTGSMSREQVEAFAKEADAIASAEAGA
jgi:hypothetical protein